MPGFPNPEAFRDPPRACRISSAVTAAAIAAAIAGRRPGSPHWPTTRHGTEFASQHHGNAGTGDDHSILCGLAIPRPVPIGEPSGINAAQPVILAQHGSSAVYGRTTNPSSTTLFCSPDYLTTSGHRVRLSAITSSLTQLVFSASRANQVLSGPGFRGAHPAVLGRR